MQRGISFVWWLVSPSAYKGYGVEDCRTVGQLGIGTILLVLICMFLHANTAMLLIEPAAPSKRG